jgi:hypothetical protein
MTNDAKDRHVLAAAIRCGANAIVTDNAKHFPAECTGKYEIDVLTSDAFLVHQFHLEPQLMLQKLQMQAEVRRVPILVLLNGLARTTPLLVGLLTSEFGSTIG